MLSVPLIATLCVSLAGPPAPVAASPAMTSSSGHQSAVIGRQIIGHSVKGRSIRAFELGDRRARRTVVVIAVMHGDETAPATIVRTLRDGRPVAGVHLWLVPVYNPDGAHRRRRQNAHGIDLNRNYPYRWTRQTGETNSGPRPASEPETRSFMRWLNQIDPTYVVSFHQPLHGVDRLTKNRNLAHRLHRYLRLPMASFNCSGGCHGTMTQWFNHRHHGAALTVELGSHPSQHYLTQIAPGGLLRAVCGHLR